MSNKTPYENEANKFQINELFRKYNNEIRQETIEISHKDKKINKRENFKISNEMGNNHEDQSFNNPNEEELDKIELLLSNIIQNDIYNCNNNNFHQNLSKNLNEKFDSAHNFINKYQ